MTPPPDKGSVASQLRRNRAAYNEVRDKMEADHPGRFALMNDGQIVDIYSDGGDAYSIGCDKFGLGNFSIEKIGDMPISLGIHAMCVSD